MIRQTFMIESPMKLRTMKIKFEDGEQFTAPDVSEEFFAEHYPYSGISDIEYGKYLRSKGMKRITDFNPNGTSQMTLEVRDGERVIRFKCIFDSDSDV